jgi:flagellar biosynthesis/type III secretory pathway M-ring protein FliF/YscJ
MAGFQETISNAASHLRQMTLSQRVAIMMGVVLVAGSLAWMIQWAASPEMVPLLHQQLSAEDVAQVTAGLDMINEPYESDGSQVYVRASANRPNLLARLQIADKMPSDTSVGFAELVREANPWISQAENNRRWSLALQNELERVLTSFAGVKRANVFLNLGAPRAAFSRNQPESSASATITMRDGTSVPRNLAISAARLISGAVQALPLHNVEVLDSNGRAAIEWDAEEDGGVSDLARRQRQQESEIAKKILSQIDFIPDVKVNVQVVLNRTASTTNASDVKEGAKIEQTSFEEQSARQQRSGQPGVQPNVGVATGAGSGGDTMRREETSTSIQPSVQKTLQTTPAGGVEQSFAAISVSDQFLVSVFKRGNPDVEPTEQQIEQVFERQKDRIAAQVAKLVFPPDVEQISMSWHYSAARDPVEPAAAVDVAGMAGTYGPAAGLGALALVSLFLMMRMAKQNTDGQAFGMEIGLPKEAIDAARRAAGDVAAAEAAAERSGATAKSAAASIPFGTASEGLIEAPEVDAQVVEIGKMLEQVAAHANEDEDGVAVLIERWASNR